MLGNSSNRSATLKRLEQDFFDVLIIGAGINGAVSAASLAHQGYRVALVDQGDFASQTSQASSNLIWGGIKYLENYEFSLVRKLCLSRNRLMKAFPSLIQEVRFFMPVSRSTKSTKKEKEGLGEANWKRHPWLLYMGMWFYWWLGGRYTSCPHMFSSSALRGSGYPLNFPLFKGALEYSDAYLPENDSRLVYRFVEQAEESGAVVSNYVRLKKAEDRGEDFLASLEDRVTGKTFPVRARFLINASGPFIDRNNRALSISTKHRHVLSKGVHLIFPRIFPEKIITFFDEDDRLFFAIPMGPRTMVGTTDTRVEKPETKVSQEDRDFLIRNINRFLDSEHQLTEKDIIAERCGVRPLVVKSDVNSGVGTDKDNWFQLSRKHSLEMKGRVLSIFGGKLTDCINIGEEVAEKIQDHLSPSRKSIHKSKNWYEEEISSHKKQYEKQAKAFLTHIPEIEKFIPLWWTRYGSRAKKILETLTQKKKITEIGDSGYSDIELLYIVKHEKTISREDLIRRRTKLELVMKKDELLSHPFVKKLIKEHRL